MLLIIAGALSLKAYIRWLERSRLLHVFVIDMFLMQRIGLGIFLGFAAFAAYSFSDMFIKLIKQGLPPFEVVFFGALLGLLALPFAKQPTERWTDLVRPRMKKMWLVRVILGTINSVSAVIAFRHLSMAEAFALIFLMPIFVTLLSVLILKEQVGWKRWSAVIAGFIGVMIVLRPGFRELNYAHGAAIACGLAGAGMVITLRMISTHESRLTLFSTTLIGNILIAGIVTFWHFSMPTTQQWLYILGYGLLSAAGGVLLMYATLVAPVNRVAPTQYSQMLWAVAIGYMLFQERLDLPTWIGICVIVGAGIFTFIREEQVTHWWKRLRVMLTQT